MVSVSVLLCTARSNFSIIGLPDLHIFNPTFNSLLGQTFQSFEVIVVDALFPRRQKWLDKDWGFPVKYVPVHPNHRFWLDQKRWNICGALNTGILHAEGQLIVRIDDASEFESTFLQKFWDGYRSGNFPLAMHIRYLGGRPARFDKEYMEKGYEAKYSETLEKDERVKILHRLYGDEGLIRDTRYPIVKARGGKMIAPPDWFYGYCYDDKTEVLTSLGFKLFKDVNLNDSIATLSPEGVLEYHKPIDKQQFWYEGVLLHWKGKSYDLMVTPNHQLYVSNRSGRPFHFVDALAFSNRYTRNCEMKKDAIWHGSEVAEFTIPIPKKVKCGKTELVNNVSMDSWLEFLGWWLSEGSKRRTNGGYEISVAQKQGSPYIDEIVSCLRSLGFNPNPYYDRWSNCVSVRVSRKQLYEYLSVFGKARTKYVPQYVKELCPRQIAIFLNAFCKGDGTIRIDSKTKRSYMAVFYTSSKRMVDDLQELLLKVGLSGTILYRYRQREEYQMSVNSKRLTPQIWKKATPQQYKGYVYDLTVPHHTLFVRRNGKVVWSGNSSMSLEAALKINGFNELFDGIKGQEDQECGLRLTMAGYRDMFSLDVDHQVIEHEHLPIPSDVVAPNQGNCKCNYALFLLSKNKNRWRANSQKLTEDELEFVRQESLKPPCSPRPNFYEDDCRGSLWNLWVSHQNIFDLREEQLEAL